jgi:hypothetical protein
VQDRLRPALGRMRELIHYPASAAKAVIITPVFGRTD